MTPKTFITINTHSVLETQPHPHYRANGSLRGAFCVVFTTQPLHIGDQVDTADLKEVFGSVALISRYKLFEKDGAYTNAQAAQPQASGTQTKKPKNSDNPFESTYFNYDAGRRFVS